MATTREALIATTSEAITPCSLAAAVWNGMPVVLQHNTRSVEYGVHVHVHATLDDLDAG
jgi:hypothetical protein